MSNERQWLVIDKEAYDEMQLELLRMANTVDRAKRKVADFVEDIHYEFCTKATCEGLQAHIDKVLAEIDPPDHYGTEE